MTTLLCYLALLFVLILVLLCQYYYHSDPKKLRQTLSSFVGHSLQQLSGAKISPPIAQSPSAPRPVPIHHPKHRSAQHSDRHYETANTAQSKRKQDPRMTLWPASPSFWWNSIRFQVTVTNDSETSIPLVGIRSHTLGMCGWRWKLFGARWLVSGRWGRDVTGFACVVGGDEGVRENCMPARGPLGMGSVCVILISYGRFVWWRMDGMG